MRPCRIEWTTPGGNNFARDKHIDQYSTFKSSSTAYVSVGTQAVFTANMHSIGVFFSTHCFGLVKYSRKSKLLTALVACVPLVQKDSWSLCILISVNRILGRIKSSRFIRAKVDFHSNPTSILYFFYEEIYLELSPFAVKPMFWFSI